MEPNQVFLERWNHMFHQKDFKQLADLLAPDCVLISPIVHKPYRERQQILAILQAVTRALPDFTYVQQEVFPRGAMLVFRGKMDEMELEGIDLFELSADGLVQKLTVMVRPFKATMMFAERMSKELEHAQY